MTLVVCQVLIFRLGATAGLSSSASFLKSTGGQATRGTRRISFDETLGYLQRNEEPLGAHPETLPADRHANPAQPVPFYATDDG